MALLNASLEDIKKSSQLVQKFSLIVFHCFSGGGAGERKSPVWLELVMNNGNYEIGPRHPHNPSSALNSGISFVYIYFGPEHAKWLKSV